MRHFPARGRGGRRWSGGVEGAVSVLDFNAKAAASLLRSVDDLEAAVRAALDLRTTAAESRLRQVLPTAGLVYATAAATAAGSVDGSVDGGVEEGVEDCEAFATLLPDGPPALVAFTCEQAISMEEPAGWRGHVARVPDVCRYAVDHGLSRVALHGRGGLRMLLTERLTRALANGGEDPSGEQGPAEVHTPDGSLGFRAPLQPLPVELLDAIPAVLEGLQIVERAWVVEGFQGASGWLANLVLQVTPGVEPGGIVPALHRRIGPLVPEGLKLAFVIPDPEGSAGALRAFERLWSPVYTRATESPS
jgi:hypothetical protein